MEPSGTMEDPQDSRSSQSVSETSIRHSLGFGIVSQVVEPETHLFAFREHARSDCRWPEMVFDQHVGGPWLPSFQLE